MYHHIGPTSINILLAFLFSLQLQLLELARVERKVPGQKALCIIYTRTDVVASPTMLLTEKSWVVLVPLESVVRETPVSR